MKRIYRHEYPWYYILMVCVIFCELIFLLYSIFSISNNTAVEFIKKNISVNVVLLIISFWFLRGLIKKHLLLSYDNEKFEDVRRNINIKWEDVVDYKIEKKERIDGISMTIDSLHNEYNYILVIDTNKVKNVIILLGNLSYFKRRKIKKIFKKYLKK